MCILYNRMSKAKFLDTSTPLKDRRRSFLRSTIEHFGRDPKNNRCEHPLRGCKYEPNEDSKSKGCAIGRFLDTKTQIALDVIGDIQEIYSEDHASLLPDWMRDLGEDFLFDIQELHDGGSYWGEVGLSKDGERQVKFIRKRINQDYVK